MWNLLEVVKGLKLRWVVILFISISLFSCGSKYVRDKSFEEEANHIENLVQTSKSPKTLEKEKEKQKRKKALEPIAEDLNPLHKRVSVMFKNLPYKEVFYYIAYQSGLNLVIAPEVDEVLGSENRQNITFVFNDFRLIDILKEICKSLNIAYTIKNGVLYITPYEERIIYLNFLPVLKNSSLKAGGNVLGAVKTDVGNPLTGEFEISGEFSKDSLDIYKQLENAIKQIISEEGKFIINKTLGTLYIKDRPNNVRAVEKYVSLLQRRYLKQIVLNITIVEVLLSKNVQTGINWLDLSNFLLGKFEIDLDRLNLGINLTNPQVTPIGLNIQGTPNISSVLNFLSQYGKVKVLSNGKIRVLHAQPALISVGTSTAYIKKFTKTVAEGEITLDIETSSIFEGILVGIIPYITETQDIILQVFPIKTDILELKRENFEGGSYFLTLPKVSLREMSSIITTKPNNLLVLGGLILRKKEGREQRLNIPFISKLMQASKDYSGRTELVILIKIQAE